jgi:hypothetical protein
VSAIASPGLGIWDGLDAAKQALKTRYKLPPAPEALSDQDARSQWLMEPLFSPITRKILPANMVNKTFLPPWMRVRILPSHWF